jgi:glycosyltransferase involved in cell wall biosynthesis
VSDRLVSCIVPVHNGARYLREALDSITAQTYRPIEIIVVDDGSTDGSAAVAGRYAASIRIHAQPNAGPAAARNRGIRDARGEYLAFLDADDLWHPKKLERQVARFGAREELGFSVAHVENFWDPAFAPEEHRPEASGQTRPVPGYVAPTLVVRSTTFVAVGDFCESRPHTSEPEWFLRAAERGVIGELLPDVLLQRRLHGANRSRLRSAHSREEYLRLVKATLDRKRRERPGPLGHP